MVAFERDYLRRLYGAMQKEYTRVARLYKAGKIQQYRNEDGVIAGLGDLIMEIYERVGLYFLRRTRREVLAETKAGFGFDQAYIDDVQEYFRLFLLNKAVLPISDTTRKDILHILEQGEQEGWTIDEMMRKLENSDIPAYRARMILRTELLKAQQYGKEKGEEESDFEMDKIWMASGNDGRTRKTHLLADNQTVPAQSVFTIQKKNGGTELMTGPGDPRASAENVINCRCTYAYEARRDANGKLILKSKISVHLPK